MNPQVVSSDASCFEMILTMCETLNTVCADELEAQGHTPECSAMLVATLTTAGNLMEVVQELNEQMMERFGEHVNLTLLGDPEDNEE